jgi:hypothetical protein
MPDDPIDITPQVPAVAPDADALHVVPDANGPGTSAPIAQPQVPALSELTVHLHITLWPADGHASGRLVTMWGRALGDDPLVRCFREAEFASLPPVFHELIAAIEADLPACSERIERARVAEEQARKERDAARAQARSRSASTAKRRATSTPPLPVSRPAQPEEARIADEIERGAGPDEAQAHASAVSKQSGCLTQASLFEEGV